MIEVRRSRIVYVLIDCSGSMRGQPISIAQTELRELLSQLKYISRYTKSNILTRVILFDEQVRTDFVPLCGAGSAPPIPRISIKPDRKGLYPLSDYGKLFTLLKKRLAAISETQDSDVTLILFTDGDIVTHSRRLTSAVSALQDNDLLLDSSFCQRYVVLTKAHKKCDAMNGSGLLETFAGITDHIYYNDKFCSLLDRLSADLIHGC